MSALTTDDTSIPLPAVDLSKRYVRVTAQRDNGFIEFEFSVGWQELVVELILMPPDFKAFCEANHVEMLPPHEEGHEDGHED